MIQKLSMKNVSPLNMDQVGATLYYSQQRIQIITELLVKEYTSASDQHLLALLSTIHDVFDAISEITTMLEGSLNGIVGCVDLAVLDVQIALQVLVEAYISNCDALTEMENRSDEAIASAVYCLSSTMITLLTTMSDMAEKILIAEDIVDVNAVTGLQMIVQTILNIVDRVLYSVKRLKVIDLEGIEPSLEKFSLIIQQLSNERLNFVSKVSPSIISPISEVLGSLESNMDQLSLMTGKRIDDLVTAVASVEETVKEKNISSEISSVLIYLQPMLSKLSAAVHSIKGISDSSAYLTDISVQNLMATIKCLTYYFSIITKELPTIESALIESSLQSVLCFIASNIQTMVDAVTLVVQKALIDLICLSPTIDKPLLEKQLLELQSSMEPVILLLEEIVRTSIELLQNILSLGACAMADVAPYVIDDLNKLINTLGHIVNKVTKSVVSSKQLVNPDNQLEDEGNTTLSNQDNFLYICMRNFEGVAQNSLKLRVFLNQSIEQVRRYLIEM